jgi:hypothetical protein
MPRVAVGRLCYYLVQSLPVRFFVSSTMPKKRKGAKSDGADVSDGKAAIIVAVRVRPLLSHDRVKQDLVKIMDGKMIVVQDPAKVNNVDDPLRNNRTKEKRYAFDHVFGGDDTSFDVHQHTTHTLVDGVIDGCNATVFAYGQTGSGKTHTMIGNDENPGLMTLTLGDLFEKGDTVQREEGSSFTVTVSFLEVYNEVIRDLLQEDGNDLPLREDPLRGPVVANISEHGTDSVDEIMDLLHEGDQRRTTESTKANAVSSRSHAVLQVMIEQRDPGQGSVKFSKLSLIDLAGSERASKTENRGIRLIEGANINRSLLSLGNCINALGKKGQFVPYRDSKLTRLLKDSLGGNCRTVMLACITPATSSFEETLNTLKYANRAKNIKTKVSKNIKNVKHQVSEYDDLIQNLRSEISGLKGKLVKAHKTAIIPTPRVPVAPADDEDYYEEDDGNISASSEPEHEAVAPAYPPGQQSHAQPRRPPLGKNKRGGKAAPPPLDLSSTASLAPCRPSCQTGGATARGGMAPRVPNTPASLAARKLASAREEMLADVRQRMQIKQSVLELDDQNVQNNIEMSRLQLQLVEHEHTERVKTSHGRRGGAGAHGEGGSEPVNKEQYHKVQDECRGLYKAIEKNHLKKRHLMKDLRKQEKKASEARKKMIDEFNSAQQEVDQHLIDAEYQVGNLELEVMELEHAQAAHEGVVRHRDLTIQKMTIQMQIRDKVIGKLCAVLAGHGLGAEAREELGHLSNFINLDNYIPAAGGFQQNGGLPPKPPSLQSNASASTIAEQVDAGFVTVQKSLRRAMAAQNPGTANLIHPEPQPTGTVGGDNGFSSTGDLSKITEATIEGDVDDSCQYSLGEGEESRSMSTIMRQESLCEAEATFEPDDNHHQSGRPSAPSNSRSRERGGSAPGYPAGARDKENDPQMMMGGVGILNGPKKMSRANNGEKSYEKSYEDLGRGGRRNGLGNSNDSGTSLPTINRSKDSSDSKSQQKSKYSAISLGVEGVAKPKTNLSGMRAKLANRGPMPR